MSTIPSRKLGRSGIEISPMGLGCWAIGGLWQWLGGPGGWGEVDDKESIGAIHAAIDHGINFFDTAANYGTGHSEEILGQALADKRNQAVIATKFGFLVDEANKTVTRFKNEPIDVVANLPADCERSLRHLHTDYVDLYQLHIWDYPVEHAKTILEALEKLIQQGKIRTYGVSTDSVELASVFAEGQHCASIQHDLNVMMDAPEILDLCERQNLASVNRSPLARGALTGKYHKDATFAGNDVRHEQWSMDKFFGPTINKLGSLREILTSEGRTLTQGALAWIWARNGRTVPIPGFRNVAQVKENARAMEFGPLNEQQMKEIRSLLEG
jgi:aryl-alcohol dehydrogenase-like predicted oxidoreductase